MDGFVQQRLKPRQILQRAGARRNVLQPEQEEPDANPDAAYELSTRPLEKRHCQSGNADQVEHLHVDIQSGNEG